VPATLEQINSNIEEADMELIKKFCLELSIKDRENISHLVTRLSDHKRKQEGLADIVLDYGISTVAAQPRVMAYKVKLVDSKLIVREISNPHIRGITNNTVEAYRSINKMHNGSFPRRPDVRAETRKRRLAMRPLPKDPSPIPLKPENP
jgi:hypothetical protein